MDKKPVKIIKKDQLGILLEDINGKFGQTMECYSTLTKKIDDMDERLSSKIDGVDERLTNFQTETNSKFETVFNYLSALEPQGKKIENLDKRVTAIERHLQKI